MATITTSVRSRTEAALRLLLALAPEIALYAGIALIWSGGERLLPGAGRVLAGAILAGLAILKGRAAVGKG